MNRVLLATAAELTLALSSPLCAQSVIETTGVNSELGISPTA